MEPELHDLLQEAKADAPPMRYDVDDVVNAGRRRRRNVRVGWAVAAVVAVAAVTGIPQLLARPSAAPAPPAASPSVSPSARSTSYRFDIWSQPYTAGQFRVQPPQYGDLSGYWAQITAKDYVYDPSDSNRDPDPGQLRVYRKGLDPLEGAKDMVKSPAGTIGGRPATYVRGHVFSDEETVNGVEFQWADDSWAVAWAESPGSMSRAQLREVAATFTATPARAMTVPFTLGWVPDGFKLTRVGNLEGGGFELTLATDASVATALAGDHHAKVMFSGIDVHYFASAGWTERAASAPSCEQSQNQPDLKATPACSRWLDHDHQATIVWSTLPIDQQFRILNEIQVPAGSPVAAQDAVPPSARLPER